MKKTILLLVLSLVCLASAQTKSLTVAEFVRVNEGFSILNKALDDTGLAATLGGAQAYTLLAPSDEAFAALPSTRRNELLANPAAMKALLEDLILPGKLLAADLVTQGEAKTVRGAELRLSSSQQGIVSAGNLAIAATDLGTSGPVQISNGVVHVLDTLQGR